MIHQPDSRKLSNSPRPAAKDLIIINVVVFFLQHVLGWFTIRYANGVTVPMGALSLESLRSGHYLTLVTHLFVHQGLWHLFGNMLMVYFSGKLLQGTGMTNARFYRVYLFAGIGAGLFELFIGSMSGRAYSLIGASGAAFGLALAAVAARPWERITALIYFILPVNMYLKTLGKLLILSSLVLGVVQFLGLYNMGIAHFAHLGGGIIGFVMARVMGLKGEKVEPFPRPPFTSQQYEAFDPFSKFQRSSDAPVTIDVESEVVSTQDREASILQRYGCHSLQDFMERIFHPVLRKREFFGEESLNLTERQALEEGKWLMSRHGYSGI